MLPTLTLMSTRPADDDSGRDDDDDDDDDDGALMSPFTGDAPAGPPLRGGEAPGTAAPALDLGKATSRSAAH